MKVARGIAIALVASAASSCVIVPQNRRGRLADPLMTLHDEPLDAYRRQKVYTTREGASGGDGSSEAGGCSCQ